ncbi:SubName: Full=Uncharacterized protein {ECO:0000313/EMBL:CCA66408.1} [Serendipita indica DSM 11827]|nr:SubName: Full=Uncharacterized protein {ECO:0000313/EMBL:CCA66408.1} [Serendipita indica DSM 11827]
MEHGRLKALFNAEDRDNKISQAFQARKGPSRKPVDQSKVVAFTQASARKSKKEKEEEAAEAKRREHEREATQVFEEYVADFATAPRARGAIGFVKAGESASGVKISTSKVFDDDVEMKANSSIAQKPKGKRAMDAFLEEIKRDQAAREQRLARQSAVHGSSITSLAAMEIQGGSRDRGDPETSNLFVAHLPDDVTEDRLGEYFGQCGEITSVKIMWPRGETVGDMSRRSKTTGLSGFVSFKRRKDAEMALHRLDGVTWGGSALRVGWSKAVTTSGRVLYGEALALAPLRRIVAIVVDLGHALDLLRVHPTMGVHVIAVPAIMTKTALVPKASHQVTKDEEEFIELVAAMTRAHGRAFESNLMERERDNPQYQFLHAPRSAAGKFYDELLDPEYSSPEGFQDDGDDQAYSTDNEEVKEADYIGKNKLGSLARKRFKAMLRAMSGKRGEVARCMAFCLEHGEAAPEVANIVIASLLVDSTPVPRKIARLHLISDIIHNSAVALPSAWKFRQEFQQRLGLVFDHLSTIYHSFGGRMTAETFKRQVVAVIDVWDDRIVFPPEETSVWKDRLDGKQATREEKVQVEDVPVVQEAPQVSRFKSAFKPVTDPDGEQDMELDDDEEPQTAAPVPQVEEQPAEDEEIDGAPLEDDLDGEELAEDLDGAPIEDLDGAPLEEENLDGDPLDPEDL